MVTWDLPARLQGATTAAFERIEQGLSPPQLDRTALFVGPRGLRYHRGEPFSYYQPIVQFGGFRLLINVDKQVGVTPVPVSLIL